MALIQAAPAAASSFAPRRNDAGVADFSFCGDALLDAGAAR